MLLIVTGVHIVSYSVIKLWARKFAELPVLKIYLKNINIKVIKTSFVKKGLWPAVKYIHILL